MMSSFEIIALSITELTDAYASGALSPIDVLEAYSEQISKLNPSLNAFLTLCMDAARGEAEQSAERWQSHKKLSTIDGIFFGVKANIAVAGLPWHGGIGAYRDHIAAADAACIENLKAGGAIPIGILNMHEGALGATTNNPHFGACKNPWDEALTPGGSSGGSGAAIASGMCGFSLGTDTMGSVRIPSAYCGVVGHKPTYDVIPNEGLIDLSPSLDHIGVHARTAQDCAMVLPVLSGSTKMMKHSDKLRIGYATWAEAIDVEPLVVDQFEKVKASLEKIGIVENVDLSDFNFGALRRRGLLISEVEGYKFHQKMLGINPGGFSEEFRTLLDWGHRQSAEKVDNAYTAVKEAGNRFATFFQKYDVIVTPTTPQGPFAFSDEVPANQADFTCIANFAGMPATAVPMGREGKPPPSLQFIAAKGNDSVSLNAAIEFEKVRGPTMLATL